MSRSQAGGGNRLPSRFEPGSQVLRRPAAIPLVLAVVGHRDPIATEVPRLRSLFRDELWQLLQALPQTPLLLLNGLATGMDSEAAEVFLDVVAEQAAASPQRPSSAPAAAPDRQPHHIPRHQLVAALPQTLERYRQDFKDPSERERFERLLLRCSAILDPRKCPDLRADLPPGQELPAPHCYGQHKLFLVRHCYLLVAFHNGFETMAIGGTAQAVALQKGDVHPLFLSAQEIAASQEPGALLEIDTPRHRNQSPGQRQPRCYWLRSRCHQPSGGFAAAGRQRPLQLSDLLDTPRRLEQWNAQLANATAAQAESALRSPLQHLADRDATRRKHRSQRQEGALLLAGWLLSVLSAANPWSSLSALLITAAMLRQPMRAHGPKRRFLATRALAESLTVLDLWGALGVERDVADLFDARADAGLQWVRSVLRARGVQQLCERSQQAAAEWSPEDAATQARAWLAMELRWLERSEEQLSAQDCRLLGATGLSLATSLLLYLVHTSSAVHAWLGPRLAFLPQAWVSPLAMAGLTTGLALLIWREQLNTLPIRARYRRSQQLFRRALQAFDQAWLSDRQDPCRLLRLRCALEAVGQDKMAELNAWIAGQLRGAGRMES